MTQPRIGSPRAASRSAGSREHKAALQAQARSSPIPPGFARATRRTPPAAFWSDSARGRPLRGPDPDRGCPGHPRRRQSGILASSHTQISATGPTISNIWLPCLPVQCGTAPSRPFLRFSRGGKTHYLTNFGLVARFPRIVSAKDPDSRAADTEPTGSSPRTGA